MSGTFTIAKVWTPDSTFESHGKTYQSDFLSLDGRERSVQVNRLSTSPQPQSGDTITFASIQDRPEKKTDLGKKEYQQSSQGGSSGGAGGGGKASGSQYAADPKKIAAENSRSALDKAVSRVNTYDPEGNLSPQEIVETAAVFRRFLESAE